MGTSHATLAPNTKKWEKVAGSLNAVVRNSDIVADTAFSVALPLVPSGFISIPVSIAAYEGIKFAYLVKKNGLDDAAKETSIHIVEKYVAPSISASLWNTVVAKGNSEFINSTYGKIAETSFKRTVNKILTKGVKAMEE